MSLARGSCGRIACHSRSFHQPCSRSSLGCRPTKCEAKFFQEAQKHALALASTAVVVLAPAAAAYADVRLPPISSDPNRCARVLDGNTIGQANAVSDVLLDVRQCNLKNSKLDGVTLSGIVMDSDTVLDGSNMEQAVLTKAYAVGASMKKVNLSNAVLDRANLDGVDLSGSTLYNAVITGTSFEGTNLTNVIFEDAVIGREDAKRLCRNPTLKDESRDQVGCAD